MSFHLFQNWPKFINRTNQSKELSEEIEILRSAKLFLIPKEWLGNDHPDEFSYWLDNDLPIASPFDRVAIQLKDGAVWHQLLVKDSKTGAIKDFTYDELKRNQICYVVISLAEGRIADILLFLKNKDDPNKYFFAGYTPSTNALLTIMCKMWLYRIADPRYCTLGSVAPVREPKVKVKCGGQKYFIKPSVIYICEPWNNQKKAVLYEGKKIDWNCHFSVRGHWRRHDGLGKDPSGEYTITGWTWVKAHTKGDLSKPAKKQIRIAVS